jgi:hypothetical protein
MTGKITPRAENEAASGDHSPNLERDEVPFFAQLVEFLEAKSRDEQHDHHEHDVGEKLFSKEGADDHRPQEHRTEKAAPKRLHLG